MSEVANTITKKNEQTLYAWTQDPELMEAAIEIRGYYNTAKLSYLQIGKKLLEIKDKFAHGEWENFLKANADMSIRTAQLCMQAYQEYGFDPRYIEIGESKGIKLLPLPEAEREKFMAENDVKGMSVRQMERRIKEVREEEQRKAREALEAERTSGKIQIAKAMERAKEEKEKAVMAAETEAKEIVNKAWHDAREKIQDATERANDAERRAFEAESRAPEVIRETVVDPALVAEVAKYKEEVERLTEANREMIGWSTEKARMQAELDESEQTIAEQQEMLNEQKKQLLSMKSAQKRSEDQSGANLTLDTFQRVTREYMGWASILPQMRARYAGMSESEIRKWREAAETVLACMKDSLQAMATVSAEGGYSIE